MNKIKNIYKKYNLYILYLLIILVIFTSFFICKKIYPFGDVSLLKTDMISQYQMIYYEMYDRLYSGRQLVYSFNEGIGMPIYRNFLNYLSNPTMLLYFIIPNHILAIELIIILNILLIGYSSIYYLKYKFKTNSKLLLIPALCFSLCGWINAYHVNIMWLSALWMLPFITLGIEKLINEKKYKTYLFSLALAIIFNYYMGYMLCIYSAIYFFFYNLYKIKDGSLKYKLNELSKNFISFLIVSILAVGLSCVVLYPLVMTSSSLGEKINGDITKQYYQFRFIELITGHLSYTEYTCLGGKYLPNSPNVYTGLISLFSIIPFILNNKIDKKTKITYMLLFITFILIMVVPLFDSVMNMFHIPAGFPYRYSYMYSFILSILLTYFLLNMKDTKIYHLIISFISIIIIGLIIHFSNVTIIDIKYLLYNLALLISMFICFLFKNKKYIKYFLIIIVAFELCTNMIITNYTNSISFTNKFISGNNKHDFKRPSNNEFYRIEAKNEISLLGLTQNYYGFTISSSMTYSPLYNFVSCLGTATDFSANIVYVTGNRVINTLFGIKYIYTDNDVIVNDKYLSLLYGIDEKKTIIPKTSKRKFDSSNGLLNNLANIGDLYTKTKYKNKKQIFEDDKIVIYDYTYPDYTYVMVDVGNVGFFINGNYMHTIYKISTEFDTSKYSRVVQNMISITELETNHLIVCYFKDDINEDYIESYKMDINKYNELYNYLNRYPAKIDYFNENYIEASTDFDKDLSMMSTIPYDEGWHVYIDDSEVTTYTQYNTFLGFDIPKGKHKIVLKYKPPYFKEGIAISLTTLLLIIGYEIVTKIYKNKKTTSK